MSCHVIFTAIQPSGRLHLGNYFGCIKPFLKVLKEHNATNSLSLFSLADLHALTTLPFDLINQQTIETAIQLIASGLDPTSFDKLILFRQSKEKIRKLPNGTATANTGILTYPILQAADILLYKANSVPVGEDQAQHLELARFLANRIASTTQLKNFPVPEPIITLKERGGRIMNLNNPTKKMSKSDPDDFSRINIDDTEEKIYLKIKAALTDSYPRFDAPLSDMSPAMSNLVTIYRLLHNESVDITRFTSIQQFKTALIDTIIIALRPIQDKLNVLRQDPGHVKSILESGELQARSLAQQTITKLVG